MHQFLLLRHGENTWDHENRFTGWQDVPLSPRGVQEAIEAGRRLSGIPLVYELDAVLESPPRQRGGAGRRDPRGRLVGLGMRAGRLAALALAALAVPVRAQCPPTLSTELLDEDPQPYDRFGAGLAIHGTAAFVATHEGNIAFSRTSVYEFERTGPGTWVQRARLQPESHVCSTVGLRADERQLLVGLPGDYYEACGQGVVEVYERDLGGPGVWGLRQRLAPKDGSVWRSFGSPLDLDGEFLVVGEVQGGPNFAGQVHAYRRTPEGEWELDQSIDNPGLPFSAGFGAPLAVSGTRMAIGSLGEETVFLYERSAPGSWSQVAVLPSPVGGELFPYRLDLEGERMAVSSPHAQGNEGLVRIYERDPSGAWGEVAALFPAGAEMGTKFGLGMLLAGDSLVGVGNGHSGASSEDALWTFARSADGTWFEQGHVHADPSFGPQWGWRLAADRGLLLVSAIWAMPGGLTSAGLVEVYEGLDPLSPAELYCTAGTSAVGCVASIGLLGGPSLGTDSIFDLVATGAEGQHDGLFFFGVHGKQALPWGATSSWQCVLPPVHRGSLLFGSGTAGACDNAFAYDLPSHWQAHPTQAPAPGTTVQAQFWYRDPLGASPQTGLSDAVQFTVCP